jgi:hypothetical protein
MGIIEAKRELGCTLNILEVKHKISRKRGREEVKFLASHSHNMPILANGLKGNKLVANKSIGDFRLRHWRSTVRSFGNPLGQHQPPLNLASVVGIAAVDLGSPAGQLPSVEPGNIEIDHQGIAGGGFLNMQSLKTIPSKLYSNYCIIPLVDSVCPFCRNM